MARKSEAVFPTDHVYFKVYKTWPDSKLTLGRSFPNTYPASNCLEREIDPLAINLNVFMYTLVAKIMLRFSLCNFLGVGYSLPLNSR